MGITSILQSYVDIDLHHLEALDVLLREHSLTRAARVLHVSQPALSKTLARLRNYFADPLFVRVALRMEPTPKALELAAPVTAILEKMRALRTEHVPFDPRRSRRTFRFCVLDAGIVHLFPPLVDLLLREAPHIRLRALQLDTQHLEPWLDSGKIDFVLGSFPGLINGIRRQPLWLEKYVSVVKKDHPRLGKAPSLRAFAAEKHVLVSTSGTGHAHQLAERAIEDVVPVDNIICRVPMFIGAAFVVKHSDAVATLPLTLASVLADDLGLQLVRPPIKLPRIEICQYWHERFHRDPGNRWLRAAFARLFRRRRAA